MIDLLVGFLKVYSSAKLDKQKFNALVATILGKGSNQIVQCNRLFLAIAKETETPVSTLFRKAGESWMQAERLRSARFAYLMDCLTGWRVLDVLVILNRVMLFANTFSVHMLPVFHVVKTNTHQLEAPEIFEKDQKQDEDEGKESTKNEKKSRKTLRRERKEKKEKGKKKKSKKDKEEEKEGEKEKKETGEKTGQRGLYREVGEEEEEEVLGKRVLEEWYVVIRVVPAREGPCANVSFVIGAFSDLFGSIVELKDYTIDIVDENGNPLSEKDLALGASPFDLSSMDSTSIASSDEEMEDPFKDDEEDEKEREEKEKKEKEEKEKKEKRKAVDEKLLSDSAIGVLFGGQQGGGGGEGATNRAVMGGKGEGKSIVKAWHRRVPERGDYFLKIVWREWKTLPSMNSLASSVSSMSCLAAICSQGEKTKPKSSSSLKTNYHPINTDLWIKSTVLKMNSKPPRPQFRTTSSSFKEGLTAGGDGVGKQSRDTELLDGKLTWKEITQNFPFYFVLDNTNTIVDAGPSLLRQRPQAVGTKVDDVVAIKYPNLGQDGVPIAEWLEISGEGEVVFKLRKQEKQEDLMKTMDDEDEEDYTRASRDLHFRGYFLTIEPPPPAKCPPPAGSSPSRLPTSASSGGKFASPPPPISVGAVTQKFFVFLGSPLTEKGKKLKEMGLREMDLPAEYALLKYRIDNGAKGNPDEVFAEHFKGVSLRGTSFLTQKRGGTQEKSEFQLQNWRVQSRHLGIIFPFYVCVASDLSFFDLGPSLMAKVPTGMKRSWFEVSSWLKIEYPEKFRGKFFSPDILSEKFTNLVISVQTNEGPLRLVGRAYSNKINPLSRPSTGSLLRIERDDSSSLSIISFLPVPFFPSLRDMLNLRLSPFHYSPSDPTLRSLIFEVEKTPVEMKVHFQDKEQTFPLPACSSVRSALLRIVTHPGFKIDQTYASHFGLLDVNTKRFYNESITLFDIGKSIVARAAPLPNAPLAIRLCYEEVSEVIRLLKANPRFLFPGKNNILHKAAELGRRDVAMAVIASDLPCSGLWLMMANAAGETPLGVACAKRSWKVIPVLLKSTETSHWAKCSQISHDVYYSTSGEVSVLHLLAKHPWLTHPNEYKEVLMAVVGAKYKDRDSLIWSIARDERVEGLPLHWAAAYGNIMGVMFFIEVMKQSVDARGPSKSTPLYYAGVNSMWDVYMYLHKKGADQYIATVDGDLPADAFLSKVEKGNEKNVKSNVRKATAPWGSSSFLKTIWAHIKNNNPKSLKRFLNSTAATEFSEKQGGSGKKSPRNLSLLWAAARGRLGIVKMLLEDGGEGDKGKYEGKEGALVFKGAPSLLGALCRIDGSNSDETTYLSIMDLLVDRQGDVNGKAVEKAGEEGGKGGEKKGEEGEKKKSLGARVGARMTKSKLPKEGAEGADGGAGELPVVNRGGGYKEFTCVQEAVVSGNLFCLQWLLKKGAFLSLQGEMEFSLAILEGQSEIIQFLEGQVEGNLKEEYQSFANKVGRGKFFASLNSEAGSKKKKTFNEQACNAAVVNISQCEFSNIWAEKLTEFYGWELGYEKEEEKMCAEEVKGAKERVGEGYSAKVHAFVAAACGNEPLFKYILATNLLPPNSTLSSSDSLPPSPLYLSSSDHAPSGIKPAFTRIASLKEQVIVADEEVVLDFAKLTEGKGFSDIFIERFLLETGTENRAEIDAAEFEEAGELELVGVLSRLTDMMVKYHLVLHHQAGTKSPTILRDVTSFLAPFPSLLPCVLPFASIVPLRHSNLIFRDVTIELWVEGGGGGMGVDENLLTLMSSQSFSSIPSASSPSLASSRSLERGSGSERGLSPKNARLTKVEKRDSRLSSMSSERKMRVGKGGEGEGEVVEEGSKGDVGGVGDGFLYSKCQLVGRGEVLLDPSVLPEGKIEVMVMSNQGMTATLKGTIQYPTLNKETLQEIEKKNSSNSVLSSRVKTVKRSKASVGESMRQLSYSPLFPILIVPGICSSALECLKSKLQPKWERERVWVDPTKIGNFAVYQARFGKKEKEGEGKDDPNRTWLKHMILDRDGFSDQPGICVRPVSGVHGCDFLVENSLLRAQSFVVGPVLAGLYDVGYTNKNLDALTYDWRLPPPKLEERDGYFTTMSHRISAFREVNGRPVVLMAHSMGNKVVHYFLHWAKRHKGEEWINHNVHAFFSTGAPFLGAPKSIRSVVSGDRLDLDVFLTAEEGLIMCRRTASLPWLFPVDERLLPDFLRIRSRGVYTGKKMSEVVPMAASTSWDYFSDHYIDNDLYLKGDSEDGKEEVLVRPPVMSPPPVLNLWNLYGINVKTEIAYYYKETDHGLHLDERADSFNMKKVKDNPSGFAVSGGIAYEHNTTFQRTIRAHKCGDGTVPFFSLSQPSAWRKQAIAEGLPLQVQNIEIEGAEHRMMLENEYVMLRILEMVCEKRNLHPKLYSGVEEPKDI